MHHEFLTQPTDEILESVWCLREDDRATMSALLVRMPEPETRELAERLVAAGLMRLTGDRLELIGEGEERARTVVRCHRLAERLLHDVFQLPDAESEQTACLMEHVLSPAVADAVCAFLGHPPTSPTGDPIPGGRCCTARDAELRPVVVSLRDLDLGKPARIVFMAQEFHKRVDRLGSYGVVPGSIIRLRQKRPSYVLDVDGTSLALDPEVARDIYVRPEG